VKRRGIMPIRFAAALSFPLLIIGAPLKAQVGLNLGNESPGPFDVEKSTPLPRIRPKFYSKEAAKRLNWPSEQLEQLEAQGFGRTEILILPMIARKSTSTWDQLVKERQKGAALRDLAEKAGVSYPDIFREAERLREEIVQVIPSSPTAVSPSTAPASVPAASQGGQP
jgi:hypothetical protein